MNDVHADIFKPRMTAQETKADTITRAVRQIQNAETAAREAKTAKLRAARLARDAEAEQEPALAPAKATPKRKLKA